MLFIIRLNLIVLLWSIQTISVGQKIDSLEWISKQKDDTVKVKFLIRFSKSFRETDNSKTLELGIAAKSLSKKLKFAKGIFKSNDNLSIIYNNREQFGQSLKVIREMLDLSDSINTLWGPILNRSRSIMKFWSYSLSQVRANYMQGVLGKWPIRTPL